MTTHTDLIARLREGDFTGSEILEAADALEALEQRVAALVAERAKSAEQYVARLNQIDALTKERDELEISNAFAHGEWRAVKDQLAAMTTERNEAIYQTKVATQEHFDMEQELAAALAREAKLRSVLQWVLRASDLSLKEIGAYMVENGIASMPASEGTAESFSALQAVREAIALPTDDSALMERLEEEREKCALEAMHWGNEHMAAKIRSMT